MGIIVTIWNTLIAYPIINALVFFSVKTHSLALAVGILVLLIKILLLPITIQRIRDTKVAAHVNPKLEKLKKKYKNKVKFENAKKKLFSEYGYHPKRGFISLIIMFPILIALYQAVRVLVSGITPELAGLYPMVKTMVASNATPISFSIIGTDLLQKPNALFLGVLFFITIFHSWVNFKIFGTARDPKTLMTSMKKNPGSDMLDEKALAKMMQGMNSFMFILNGAFLVLIMKGLPAILAFYMIIQNALNIFMFGILYLLDRYVDPRVLGSDKVRGG